ncbi:hypothetical protein ACM01_05735 [Streptomyces viridochromogenes]|uniref:Condensation domain-containing protein n=2 Tax=Streptomyces viridochromogenes TaxID=1938 RepID=A0A0J7ZLB2_STRVR|nr:hypothetical protein ACM01_05735 [Streptomyces viridochromogenes]
MTDRLPLLSAQLTFGLDAQRAGRRGTVTMMFRASPGHLSTADVRQVLQSVVLRNPALSYRIRFSRGAAYQEWYPEECDFAELHTAGADAVPGCVTEVIEEFETSLDGAPMAARLIRSPESDNLLLVLDHALVDEQSMLLIKRQLAAPSAPDDSQLARYQAAIHDRKAFEDAAANGPGIKFWADRLEAAGEFPRATGRTTRVIPIDTLPSVAIPRSFRGSLFPYVLFSIHRALRDVAEPGPSVIGYPWGGRNGAYADVVGCFMNTVISLDPPGARQTPDAAGDFVRGWYREIDHADVPFPAVTALGSTFSGSVTALLSYTHAGERTVRIAGVPVVEVTSTHSRPPEVCSFMAAAQVRDEELHLRLLLDEEIAGYGAQEFGSRWRHWLTTAISSFPERKP